MLTDREKRSRSRSGRRESDKTNKRSTSDRYWAGGREEDGHERTRPKHAPTQHDGKGTYRQNHLTNIDFDKLYLIHFFVLII